MAPRRAFRGAPALLVAVAALLLASWASASHFRGSTLTYRIDNNDQLELTLTSSWAAGSLEYFYYYSADCAFTITNDINADQVGTLTDVSGSQYTTLRLVPGGLAAVPSNLSVETQTGGCRVLWYNQGRSSGNQIPVSLRVSVPGTQVYVDTDFLLEIADVSVGSPPVTNATFEGQELQQGATLTFNPGTSYTVTFTSSDPDQGAVLTAQTLTLPDGASLTGTPGPSPITSTFTWAPSAAVAGQSGTFQLIVTDDTNLQTTASFGYVVPEAPKDTDLPTFEDFNATDVTVEAPGPGGAYVEFFLPNATDATDPNPAVTCDHANGTFPLGTTLVTCTATDAAGNSLSRGFNIIVVNTTPPFFFNELNVLYPGVTHGDPFDLDNFTYPYPSPSNVDGNEEIPPWSDEVIYPLDDSPVWDVFPNITGAVTTLIARPAGGASTGSGSFAAASDTTEPTYVKVSLGVHVISCVATDFSNNTATKLYNLTVVDTTPPYFDTAFDLEDARTNEPYNFPYPTAHDAVDTNLTVVCDPPSGTAFPAGQTVVVCNATDFSGNSDSTSFFVLASTYCPDRSGYEVLHDTNWDVTASGGKDYQVGASEAQGVCDADPTCLAWNSYGYFYLGANTSLVTYPYTGLCTYTKLPADTTPPTITVRGPEMYGNATDSSGAVVDYTVTADDDRTESLNATCAPPSGSTFPVGTTTVNCTAADAAGNTAEASFKVTVNACGVSGFEYPLSNPPSVNTVDNGTTLALRWDMGGDFGNEIITPGFPRLWAVDCGSFEDSNDTALSYEPTLKYNSLFAIRFGLPPPLFCLNPRFSDGRYALGYDLRGRRVAPGCYQLQLQLTTCPGVTHAAYLNVTQA
ncbi:hypothetical protein HYH03_001757 [Edaphochlamys debaryana]|uniref:HYR domain-containing protein n=1 Tax=Edaphochlamys debaryana TaxID=47281 RepID=A0A835YC23_9CHLO|nr:hypothetical protein HYH03_001757 [Edaphochlamys debaryana]|eukprot:KAG2500175.1 hypothetical protein HYH03_001757 [Edaphochlamys debaryana]